MLEGKTEASRLGLQAMRWEASSAEEGGGRDPEEADRSEAPREAEPPSCPDGDGPGEASLRPPSTAPHPPPRAQGPGRAKRGRQVTLGDSLGYSQGCPESGSPQDNLKVKGLDSKGKGDKGGDTE